MSLPKLTVFGLPDCSFLVLGSSYTILSTYKWTNSLVPLMRDLATFSYQSGPPHRIKHKKNLMQRGPQRMVSSVSVACAGKKNNLKKGSREKNHRLRIETEMGSNGVFACFVCS